MSLASLLLMMLAAPSQAEANALEAAPLSDEELAGITGKFLLPNGASIAMAVTSDTLVDGQLVLRSVLSVDDRASVNVFGANPNAPTGPSVPRGGGQAAMAPSGVTVLFDRQSGMRTITPTYAAAPTVGVTSQVAPPAGDATAVIPLPLTPGAAVETAAGLVSLSASGRNVTLQGDRIDVTHILGPAFATAIANTANDRTIDTVTTIDLDLTRVTPFSLGSAAIRAGDLALDATRGMMR